MSDRGGGMRVLDLFSGIGGFSLGLERAGMLTVAFCEIEPYARRVLAKHWPEVPIYEDIRTLTAEQLAADGIAIDLICGGFPCQDISVAGKGAGIAGERSGLWSEFARLIGELRPSFVIVENVAALLGRGMGTVLGDLAALGYDAEWHCIPASAVGAPHRRDRVWIVAYPNDAKRGAVSGACGRVEGAQRLSSREEGPSRSESSHPSMADAVGLRQLQSQGSIAHQRGRLGHGSQPHPLRDANSPRLALWESIACDDGEEQSPAFGTDWWIIEPDVGRVAYGVPDRVDRLKGLGNAVVPQIPEAIGRAIMAAEAAA